DRIIRMDVHIDHWRKGPMNPGVTSFTGSGGAERVCQVCIIGCGNGEGFRKRHATTHEMARTGLKIRGNDPRNGTARLQLRYFVAMPVSISDADKNAAEGS